ncbi:MAG: hypothetical protein IJ863_03335 [Spirochaetales bacterium]|nr:hypothetical protein [Spirochaetales bacterium]
MFEDLNLLYKIATLYYESGYTQDEISKKVIMSRPMISRALDKARQIGIVKISVVPPSDFAELSSSIAKGLGIRDVIVAPSINATGNDGQDRLNDVTEAAARFLEREVSGGMNIGLGWGNTVYETSLKLRKKPFIEKNKPRVTPLVGNIGDTHSEYQCSVIVNKAADMLNATAYYYNISMLEPYTPEQIAYFKSRYSEIYDMWDHLDMAVIGLGAYTEKSLVTYPLSEYSQEYRDSLKRNNLIGDVVGYFFNEQGIIARNWAETLSRIPVNSISSAKRIVCVCCGTEKIRSIRTAAKLELFNTLITDYKTALELKESL